MPTLISLVLTGFLVLAFATSGRAHGGDPPWGPYVPRGGNAA